MTGLDPSIQAPARLKLMTMLTAVSEAEFSTLRDSLDVSDSVLSKHVAALGTLAYVKSRKGVHLGRRTTWISLTTKGRKALSAHVAGVLVPGLAWMTAERLTPDRDGALPARPRSRRPRT